VVHYTQYCQWFLDLVVELDDGFEGPLEVEWVPVDLGVKFQVLLVFLVELVVFGCRVGTQVFSDEHFDFACLFVRGRQDLRVGSFVVIVVL